MTHQRIRKFNTRKMFPGQSIDNDLCQAVVTNHAVYLSGQVPLNEKGELVGKGDPAAQAEQAMRNVASLLNDAGCTLSDVVKITIYITDRANREPVYQVVGRWLKGVYPACTGLLVSGLAGPDWLMEIDVIAEK
ncbi:MAG: RidA family protein [Hyphomicrobiaceae bacterium]